MNVIVCDGRSSRKINLCPLIPPLKEIRASMSVKLSRRLLSLLIYFLGNMLFASGRHPQATDEGTTKRNFSVVGSDAGAQAKLVVKSH